MGTHTKYSLFCPHTIDILCTATHTHRNTPSHSQTIVSNMQSQGQTSTRPESLRVTKSHPKYTQSHKDADSHNHSCTHLVTHTCRVTKSLTHRQIQSNTQSHTQRNRHTQLHTGPWRRRTMDTLFELAAAGEEGAAVWTQEAVGAAVPTPTPAASSKPLPFPRSQILLGPRFAERLGSHASPCLQLPATSGG